VAIRHEHGRVVSLLGTEAAETAFNIYRVSRDNSQADIAGEPLLQAYRLDGTMQWQINLGRNIREGVHCSAVYGVRP
jgi:rhamnogalacturonan endolyase